MQSCRVQSEGLKNESKGLQETGLSATTTRPSMLMMLVLLLIS